MAALLAFGGMYPYLVAVDNADIGVLFGFHLPQLGVTFGPVFHTVFVVIHTAPSLNNLAFC